jgi:hypothetical protein
MAIETIALFDMDDTLFNHNGKLNADLQYQRAPGEPAIELYTFKGAERYLIERARAIRATKEWWANLPKFKLGWDIWALAGELGFKREILTKANLKNPNMWLGKVECIIKHLGTEFPLTITSSEKGRQYGRVLVDDYPPYAMGWLKHRPRGLVVMPAHKYNEHVLHPQIIRYTGENLDQVKMEMGRVKVE